MPRIESFQSEMVKKMFQKGLRTAKQKNDDPKMIHYSRCLDIYWEHRLKRLDERLGIEVK